MASPAGFDATPKIIQPQAEKVKEVYTPMRKILAISISLAMLLALFAVPVPAVSGLEIGISTASNVAAGAEVELNLTVDANPAGIGHIHGVVITVNSPHLNWVDTTAPTADQDNPSVVAGALVTGGDAGMSMTQVANAQFATNKAMTLFFDTRDAVTGTGVLATLKLKVADTAPAGTSLPVTLSVLEATTPAADGLTYYEPIDTKNGAVNVAGTSTGGVTVTSVAVKATATATPVAMTTMSKNIPSDCYSVVIKLSEVVTYSLEKSGAANPVALAVATDEIELRTTATIKAGDLTVTFTRWGDVNGDGNINVTDINEMRAHVAGNPTGTGMNFDTGLVTREGIVNVSDINALRAYAAGNVTILTTPTAGDAQMFD